MRATSLAVLTLLAIGTGCRPEPPAPATDTLVSAAPPAVKALQATPWPLPPDAQASQPDLVRAPDGTLLLSWIEPLEPGHALRFSRFADGAWSAPRTIAQGRDWFVNWADTPHLQATADGALWAHWLRKTAAAPYAYDVVLARSGDGGSTWSSPVAVNADGTPTEHGFVSLWAAAPDRLGVAWLDGRHTAGAAHGAHGGGMMTLRAATFDAALARHDEQEIDASTCDCCQTDIAQTARGALLVYRDRTAQEIRDIAATRLEGHAWSAPRYVHADRWTMPACPVNGPAVAADGMQVVTAWYTGAADAPTIKLARSVDAGDTFATPLVLDRGVPVLGRVDVALDGDRVWTTWLREDEGGQSLWLARMPADLGRVEQRLEVARLQGRGRGTGLPRMAVAGGQVHLVWTDLVDGKRQLNGATVALR